MKNKQKKRIHTATCPACGQAAPTSSKEGRAAVYLRQHKRADGTTCPEQGPVERPEIAASDLMLVEPTADAMPMAPVPVPSVTEIETPPGEKVEPLNFLTPSHRTFVEALAEINGDTAFDRHAKTADAFAVLLADLTTQGLKNARKAIGNQDYQLGYRSKRITEFVRKHPDAKVLGVEKVHALARTEAKLAKQGRVAEFEPALERILKGESTIDEATAELLPTRERKVPLEGTRLTQIYVELEHADSLDESRKYVTPLVAMLDAAEVTRLRAQSNILQELLAAREARPITGEHWASPLMQAVQDACG